MVNRKSLGILLTLVLVSLLSFLTTGCRKENPFEFIETRSGQAVFLNAAKGNLIYVDESNRIVDHVSLNPDSTVIADIAESKDTALRNKNWGSDDIPGTEYSVSLSTRFYNNRLLYILKITPFDSRVRQFARTISIDLADRNGFNLEEIESTTDWTTTVDGDGEPIGLNTQGGIPITLRNYLEIYDWSPRWATNR